MKLPPGSMDLPPSFSPISRTVFSIVPYSCFYLRPPAFLLPDPTSRRNKGPIKFRVSFLLSFTAPGCGDHSSPSPLVIQFFLGRHPTPFSTLPFFFRTVLFLMSTPLSPELKPFSLGTLPLPRTVPLPSDRQSQIKFPLFFSLCPISSPGMFLLGECPFPACRYFPLLSYGRDEGLFLYYERPFFRRNPHADARGTSSGVFQLPGKSTESSLVQFSKRRTSISLNGGLLPLPPSRKAEYDFSFFYASTLLFPTWHFFQPQAGLFVFAPPFLPSSPPVVRSLSSTRLLYSP